MPDYIRVRFEDTKTEQTIVKPHTLEGAGFTVLDTEATDANGDPLPPKFPAQNTKTGQKATNDKERN